MTPRKLDLLIITFSYGGNGGIRSAHPDVYHWLLDVMPKAKADPRIGRVGLKDLADTPITMTRNQAVLEARKGKFDVLLMIDSDQSPDFMLGADPLAKPFWESSFDFLYNHYDRGPVVVAAPYCGPPPDECAYVFRWRRSESNHPNADMRLTMFSREEAAERTGIEPVAAIPTGVTLWDIRCFEVTEPKDWDGDEADVAHTRQKPAHSWFYYEYKDKYEAQKASTEDVTATRDLSMIGEQTLGYNPVHCNWDAWAGHWKPKNVGKPVLLTTADVGTKFRQAIDNLPRNVRVQNVKTNAAAEFSAEEREQLRSQYFKNLEADISNGHASTNGNGNGHAAPESEYLPIVYDERRQFIVAGWLTCEADISALKSIASVVADRRKGPGDIVVAEIGSWGGGSALAIHEGLGQRSHEIHCIDTWDGGIQADLRKQIELWGGPDVLFDVFRKNMGSLIHDKVVFPHRMTSLEAAEHLDFPFDMVFVDAGHDYESCYEDIMAWLPRVRDGGILCGHDYCEDFPGVVRAVNEVFGRANRTSGLCMWHVVVTEELKSEVLERLTAQV